MHPRTWWMNRSIFSGGKFPVAERCHSSMSADETLLCAASVPTELQHHCRPAWALFRGLKTHWHSQARLGSAACYFHLWGSVYLCIHKSLWVCVCVCAVWASCCHSNTICVWVSTCGLGQLEGGSGWGWQFDRKEDNLGMVMLWVVCTDTHTHTHTHKDTLHWSVRLLPTP